MVLRTTPGKTGGPRSNLQVLAKTKMGVAAPEVVPALLVLHNAVMGVGEDFRVPELHRDVAVQVTAREKYDRWVAASKPPRAAPAYNAATMKSDFGALPAK